MSRPRKGARLRLRKARPHKNQAAVWCIIDGQKEYSTGFGEAELERAEEALGQYLSTNRQSTVGQTALNAVMVADVITCYLDKKEPLRAISKLEKKEPLSKDDVKAVRAYREILLRSERLVEWWGDKFLIEINEDTCADYVTWRTSKPNRRATRGGGKPVSTGTARRDLEDLRAAVGRYHAQYTLPGVPVITLPEKSKRRERWLDRHEVSRAILACLGWRWHSAAKRMGKIGTDWNAATASFEAANLSRTQKGIREQIRTRRRHVARFILIGYYTASRHNAMLEAEWVPSKDSPFVDVDAGLFYRKGKEVQETTKRQPPVRIPSRLLAHLRRWRRLDMAKGITHVVHVNGRKLTSKLRTSWEGMAADAGFETDVVRHTLRHTAVTTLMQGGMPTTDAADFAGMSEQVLKESYYHHHPDYQAKADDAFAQARERSIQIQRRKAGGK